MFNFGTLSTRVSNTRALVHWNGPNGSKEIVDYGNTGYVVTQNGSTFTSIIQSKVGTNSCFFDGSTGYLSIPHSDDWAFGSGNFTINFWFYPASIGSTYALISQSGATASNCSFRIFFDAQARVYGYIFAPTTISFGGSDPVSIGWHHVALVRNGNTVTLYVDGIACAGAANVTGLSLNDSTSEMLIGRNDPASGTTYFFNGYMDEVRIVKGQAIVPALGGDTGPYISTANTKLLLHMDSQNVAQSGGYPALSFSGSAKISTADSKFGGSSLLLNGTTDYVILNSLPKIMYDGFSMSCWIKTSDKSLDTVARRIFSKGSGTTMVDVWIDSTTGYVNAQWAVTTRAGNTNVADGNWHYIYIGRGTIYVDGVLQNSAFIVNSLGSGLMTLYIGRYFSADQGHFNGYIDEFKYSSDSTDSGLIVPTQEWIS